MSIVQVVVVFLLMVVAATDVLAQVVKDDPAAVLAARNTRRSGSVQSGHIVRGVSSGSNGAEQAKDQSKFGTQTHKVIIPYAVGTPSQ